MEMKRWNNISEIRKYFSFEPGEQLEKIRSELKNKLKQFHLDTTNGEYKNTEQQENYETANSALEFVDEILSSNLPAGTQALVEVIHDQNTVLQELISKTQEESALVLKKQNFLTQEEKVSKSPFGKELSRISPL